MSNDAYREDACVYLAKSESLVQLTKWKHIKYNIHKLIKAVNCQTS